MTSAGLLLFSRTDADGGLDQLLLAKMGGPFWAKKNDHAWSVPKGIVDDGEDLLGAAVREFTEEMGSSPPDGESIDLGSVKSGNKLVFVFAREGGFDAANAMSNTFEMEWPPRSGRMAEFPEMERAEWVSPDDARRLLVKSQVPFIDRLAERLDG